MTPHAEPRWEFRYNGGSFVAGMLVGGVLAGLVSPWWLVLLPCLFVNYKPWSWRWDWPR